MMIFIYVYVRISTINVKLIVWNVIMDCNEIVVVRATVKVVPLVYKIVSIIQKRRCVFVLHVPMEHFVNSVPMDLVFHRMLFWLITFNHM
jgi:hypothetical protein